MRSSASSRVSTLNVDFHPLPSAEVGSLSSGATRMYRTPCSSRAATNSGCFSRTRSSTLKESTIGVSPPRAAGRSQKKRSFVGYSGSCAISWCHGIFSLGGDSLAVKTTSLTTLVLTAFPPMYGKFSSPRASTKAAKSSGVWIGKSLKRTAPYFVSSPFRASAFVDSQLMTSELVLRPVWGFKTRGKGTPSNVLCPSHSETETFGMVAGGMVLPEIQGLKAGKG
mmetsp:Transcript_15552/g.31570  ORF Transcript_15552/g.31570 Transcript_15552/m.31570 type:complete len:224 (+) Transcript_15552:763-1434(+)